jgi:hypothetical protein
LSVFRRLEDRLEGLVRGTFSRAFSSEVQPIELARRLAREMDANRTASVSRIYVPNRYTVYLSPADHERLEGYEGSLGQELSSYLLEHARTRGYELLTRPEITFETDDRLRLGEFGIQARMVKAPDREGTAPDEAGEGRTMVYRAPKPAPQPAAPEVSVKAPPSASVEVEGRSYDLAGTVAVGRSEECGVVLDDPNVSRRHAEFRPRGADWHVVDLGSTNGVKVNGRVVGSSRLRDGDRITLGTTTAIFSLDDGS